MIGRMTRAREMKKPLPLGPRIAVDQHRLFAAFAGLAAMDAALAAGTKARVIRPRPVDLRGLAVILFETRAHFALELFLQAKRRRQHRVRVGVLSLQKGPDVGRQPARIAQHFAPIVGPHPGIVVYPRKTVGEQRYGPDLGSGRRRDRGLRDLSARRSLAGHDARVLSERGSARNAAGTRKGASQRAHAPAARSSSAPP